MTTYKARILPVFLLAASILSGCVLPGRLRNLLPPTETPLPPTSTPTPETPTPFIPGTIENTPTITPSYTPTATHTPSYTPTQGPTATFTPLAPDAVAVHFLALDDNGYSHLFALSPGILPLTRLTNGLWDDINPNLSPDGTKLAFASSRNEYFDLYLLDLTTGKISRLTNSPAYDANPSWSPDGQWILFETYVDDNLEVAILSVKQPDNIIRLTNSPSVDQQPIWSPSGRQIIFSSNRSGNFEIWAANLDTPGENRFQNISQSPNSDETHPAWKPDGSLLAWDSAGLEYQQSIFVWNPSRPQEPATLIGLGGDPAWGQVESQLTGVIQEANQTYLLSYASNGQMLQPPISIAENHGLAWRFIPVTGLAQTFANLADLNPTPLYEPLLITYTPIPESRAPLKPLVNVKAPHAYLHDSVDESFMALRARIIQETGWDALAQLENAYTPLTSPLDPGRGNSWLYTGRAFDLNPLPLNAGWMYIVREDARGETYWRLYIRTTAQDGSQGEPMRLHPWDINARYNLHPLSYEQGGQVMDSVPSGYWVDLTRLARQYDWLRPPAQTNWRTYFRGTLFNEFIQTGNLSWRNAMLELYPADVLVTPTIVIPPTRTPTVTPTGYRYKTPTPTPSYTPTMLPTYTPEP